jgi:hypothetical protein
MLVQRRKLVIAATSALIADTALSQQNLFPELERTLDFQRQGLQMTGSLTDLMLMDLTRR